MGGHLDVARTRLVGRGQRLIMVNASCSLVDAVNPQPLCADRLITQVLCLTVKRFFGEMGSWAPARKRLGVIS